MHRLASAAIILTLSLSPGLPAAQAPDQRPSFRTGVDLLTVEAAVFDRDGRPVSDLQSGDFTVTVDGKPRKVLFSTYRGATRPGPAATAVTEAMVPIAEHRVNMATVGGQIVIFAIDRETIRTGGEKAMIEAAGSIVAALSPADAIGLKGLPIGGVELTRDHQQVVAALAQMTGTMPPVPWRWHITWEEAQGIERGDKQMLAQVLNRECRAPRRPTQEEIEAGIERPPLVPEGCDRGVPAQANEMLLMARTQARSTMASLSALIQRLVPLRGPKHLVLMSAGMRFDQDLLGDYKKFADEAAAAGVILHVIHADQPDTDVATERRTITSPFGGREMSAGLTTMAGMTGGAFYQGVGSAAGVFERIATEMTSLYELGLESSAADADGRGHELKIAVARPGVSVRARASIAVPAAEALAAFRGDPLLAALRQPTDVADLPLAVSAYTTRGDEANLLRVLVAGEVELPAGATAAEWAFTVLNEGNAVASGRRKMDPGITGRWSIAASAKLAPGRYRLRFAARASDGRVGIVDLPMAVGLRAAGDLQMSDLIIGTAEGSRLQPSGRVPPGGDVRAMIELLSADPQRLARSRVALEIIPAGSSEPLQRLLMAARSGTADSVLMNEAQLDVRALPVGRYTATAVALVDGQPVGRVSRVFEVK